MTEDEAEQNLKGDLDIYVSKFKPMKNTLTGRDEKTLMKMIVQAASDEVKSILSISISWNAFQDIFWMSKVLFQIFYLLVLKYDFKLKCIVT